MLYWVAEAYPIELSAKQLVQVDRTQPIHLNSAGELPPAAPAAPAPAAGEPSTSTSTSSPDSVDSSFAHIIDKLSKAATDQQDLSAERRAAKYMEEKAIYMRNADKLKREPMLLYSLVQGTTLNVAFEALSLSTNETVADQTDDN